MLTIAPHFDYRLEDDRLCRCSSGYFHPQIRYKYTVYDRRLRVGDILTDLESLASGPYSVTEIGNDSDGLFARIKEIPYIEYLKKQGEYKHIGQASFPFNENIVNILYNIRRMDNPHFFQDIVLVTRSGYIFSFNDVMQSEDVGEERWPLKKYLPAIISATEVYTECHSISKGLEFFKKLIIPSEIQIARYTNGKLGYHINLNPGSGYYWI